MIRKIPIRYGLRSLVMVITGISVGVWCWWYVPFELEKVVTDPTSSPLGVEFDDAPIAESFIAERAVNPFEPSLPGFYRREVQTVRRHGFDGIVRHGITRAFDERGKKRLEENWQNGERHGEFKLWNSGGVLLVGGQFESERMHGPWRFYDDAGRIVAEREYANGVPDGTWVAYKPAGFRWRETRFQKGTRVRELWHCDCPSHVHTRSYDNGRLVRLDGKPLRESTERMLSAPDWIQRVFDDAAFPEYDRSTMSDIIMLLRKQLNDVPICIDPMVKKSEERECRRYSSHRTGMPFRVQIALLLRESGMVCDFRFEQVVITTSNDATLWKDQTGVDDLELAEDSRLAQILNQKTGVEIGAIADLAAIFDDSVRFDNRLHVNDEHAFRKSSIHTVQLPVRYWLHRFLGRENLTCKVDDGRLVVQPLECSLSKGSQED